MSPCLPYMVLAVAVGLVSSQRIDLRQFLQPDKVTSQQFNNPPRGSTLCARNCVRGEEPKLCYYKWIAEDYVTLGPACGNCLNNSAECNLPQCVVANGFEKSIKTINRMVPGPSIEVCLGDRIIIDVTNNMAGSQLAIHWHGVWQQGTQYMDGVPMVTQCSIHEAETFRYDFLANNPGTHYWHSHDGLQKLDGIQGNLVIRDPNDVNRNTYDIDDPDHVLMILDWMNTTAEERFPGLTDREPGQLPITFLPQGRGRPKLGTSRITPPYQEVPVDRGRRYRLRLVAGMCTVCGVEVRIENHALNLIATDGASVNPVLVDSVQFFSGERYDVVINANQNPGTYWIHIRGLAECNPNTAEEIYQVALLRYSGTNQVRQDIPGYWPNFRRQGSVLNPQNATCANGQGGVCVSQLTGSERDTLGVLDRRPKRNIVLPFGFHIFPTRNDLFQNGRYRRYFVAPDRTMLTSWVNNISFVSPSAPLLTQGPDIDPSTFCPSGNDGLPRCPSTTTEDYCECVHVIKIKLGDTVQMVLGDSSPVFDLHHPFHLHGYDFFVIAMDQFRNGETLQSISQKLYDTNFRRSDLPARKDTIVVPSNGYTAIRFKADNPGVWFFHCHFMYHLASGMAVLLQVGEDGDWPIPEKFPKCGNYMLPKYFEEYTTLRKRGRQY